jgi:hypothetical protein
MTPDIKVEWDKHQSRFACEWRSRMVAKRKLVPVRTVVNADLWTALENLAQTDQQRAEIVKDICLLEAALETEQLIVSLDENTARYYFTLAAQSISILKTIVWVNPDRVDEEQPEIWLEEGAPSQKQRMLGFLEPEN